MIMPSDEDYQQTKRLKKEGSPLQSPFKELADCIHAEFGVRVLNIRYDTVIPVGRPRLSVIFDTWKDARQFRKDGGFDSAKQERIRQHFEIIVRRQRDSRFNVDSLFVVFDTFEEVARIEANENVTSEEVEHLKVSLNNPDLWTISRTFDGVTFFFYTDAQAKVHEARGLRRTYAAEYAAEYAKLIAPHDDFGYLRRVGVAVHFDSKENLDNNYNGNWYAYYK